jgi:hypothetical protein
MIYSIGLRKLISMVVIIAFVFYSDIFVYSQSGGDIAKQFQRAKDEYNNAQYVNARNRIERIIGTIKDKGQEKKDIIGACYLLLGAIYEREGNTILAEENYRRVKKEYGVESIAGVDLNGLAIYRRVVKGEIDIDTPFWKAVEEYNNAQYDNSKSMLEQVIATIKEGNLDKKEILGQCYLVLGAISEKKGETHLAEEFYRQAKGYGGESVEGASLENLIIYRKIIRGKKIIEEEGKKPGTKQKKFPVLLVIGGAVVVAVAIIILTKKKPPPPNPEFVTNTNSIDVPEGGTAAFDVRLSSKPSANVSVSVTRVSGDTDINVQAGSSLTFTTASWNQDQTVTLAANEDVDTSNGTAVIQISAPGIQNKDLRAVEQDNDVLRFVTDKDIVNISEGETNFFTVMLSNEPDADIQASVTRVSGDLDISVQSGGNPTFTTSNWNIPQTVILRAAEDPDTLNGQAVIRINATGIQDKDITAVEDDNDSEGCNISIAITSPLANDTVSGTVPIRTAVTGNCVVDRVEFYIDSVLRGTDISEPYSYDWDTTIELEGPHVLRVIAYSTTGKNKDSQITVTVTR